MHCPIFLKLVGWWTVDPRSQSHDQSRLAGRAFSSGNAALNATFLVQTYFHVPFYFGVKIGKIIIFTKIA